jgi:hypothetical protein
MAQERVRGFVVAIDETSKGTKVKVRVKDSSSPFDGRKCLVVSTRDNVALVQGLLVTFIAQDAGNVLKAVDVQVPSWEWEDWEFGHRTVDPTKALLGSAIFDSKEPDMTDNKSQESINLMVTKMDDQVGVYVTPCTTRDDAAQSLREAGSEDEDVIAFVSLSENQFDDSGAFGVVRALLHCDNTRNALEEVFMEVFEVGRNTDWG